MLLCCLRRGDLRPMLEGAEDEGFYVIHELSQHPTGPITNNDYILTSTTQYLHRKV